MTQLDALHIVSEIASHQWGMVTTSQVQNAGVDRMTISRLAASGLLVRLRRGVFRLRGAPPTKDDRIRAAWLSLDPRRTASERLLHPEDDYVVSGATGAYVLVFGDMDPEPFTFAANHRRQITGDDIRIVRRSIDSSDIIVRKGLPIFGIERIAYELLRENQDVSLVADFIRDAREAGAPLNKQLLSDMVKYRAHTLGMESGERLVGILLGDEGKGRGFGDERIS